MDARHDLNNPDDTLGAYVRHGDKVVGLLQAGVGDYYLGEGGRMDTRDDARDGWQQKQGRKRWHKTPRRCEAR